MTEPESLATSEFRVSRTQILRQAFAMQGKWPAVICATLFLGFIFAAVIFDLRFLVVALMVLFIATPAVAAYLYFSIVLRPTVAFNALPHTVRITSQGAEITIRLSQDEESPQNPSRENPQSLHHSYIIPEHSIGAPIRTIHSLIYPIRTPHPGFIQIPYSALLPRP